MRKGWPALCGVALVVFSAAALEAAVDPEWLQTWQAVEHQRPAHLESTGRLAPADEPGTPLVVAGRVFEPDGTTPAPGVVVFAYHTDRDGLYVRPGAKSSIWRLHGWVVSDREGRFELRTIRPGPYPGRHVPAHIHFVFSSSEHGRQWSDSLRFADDPFLTEKLKQQSAAAGRFGSVRPVERDDGVERVEYFVRLKPSADF